MSTKKERTLAAYHEAGHVVLSVACQWPVHSSTIEPRALDATTQAKMTRGCTDVRLDVDVSSLRDDKVKFLRYSMSALAGTIAEASYLDGEPDSSVDVVGHSNLLKVLFGSTYCLEALIRLTHLLTESYWQQIEAVAKSLLAKGTIYNTEIDSLLADVPRVDLTDEAARMQFTEPRYVQ
jgi:hypothetical protein